MATLVQGYCVACQNPKARHTLLSSGVDFSQGSVGPVDHDGKVDDAPFFADGGNVAGNDSHIPLMHLSLRKGLVEGALRRRTAREDDQT